MADNLYITATEARSGKSAISLGIMELVLRKVERVAFFRPIVASAGDNDIDLIASHFKLDTPYEDMFGVTSEEASELIGHGREEEIIEKVIDKYQRLSGDFGFILCEGTDFASVTAAFELDINAEISNNLGSPVLLVANAHQKTPTETIRTIDMALDSLTDKGCQTVATIVNRVNPLQR
ncbi:MAG: AAA family ATPase, partial [Deltaproteobacteria bacterium]|nr:AAA family ATPase [Deltaproteobacteria bacterium]MBW2126412.1 AAA family ATPase [Deltaproteobacteria bacterium]